jgi:hypothetical protein
MIAIWIIGGILIFIGAIGYEAFKGEEFDGSITAIATIVAISWPILAAVFVPVGIIAGLGYLIWRLFNILGRQARK